LWDDNKLAVVVGRTIDWPESTTPILTVFPRGMKRDGGHIGSAVSVQANPARWTSTYGSLVTTVYGIGTADGFNERGLAAHMLYLRATDFGPRDPSKPGVHAGLWAQYLLDNAATVAEALALVDTIQVVMTEAHGHKTSVHLAIEDTSGDSAIIEYIGGKPVIHHGRQFQIMTNDPPYNEQPVLLKQQDSSKPSMDMPLPGNVNAVDRFQRAVYYKAVLPEPQNEREAVSGVLAIARNVSVPFDAPYRGFRIYNTEYRPVINLTTKRYFFELTPWRGSMDVSFTHGAGLDVHKKRVMACRLLPDPTGKQADGLMEVREFGTLTIDLLALSDWLAEAGITPVAMESTAA
jgi:penicillin V acylase-like amidase (Ntn superfamily)